MLTANEFSAVDINVLTHTLYVGSFFKACRLGTYLLCLLRAITP